MPTGSGERMIGLLKLYVLALPVLLVVDGVWLGLVAKGFYRRELGPLMLDGFRLGPAALFYLLYAAGLVVLAIEPGLGRGSVLRAAVLGGVVGLVAYAAYDLTNYATLRGFTLRLVTVDLLWGTLMSAGVAGAAAALARALRWG
jgi:uncharacterized membrane protein